MKVVLLRSVDNLGQAGSAVEVKRGYYRNFLGPRGLALEATPNNMKVVEQRRKKLDSLVAREKTDAEQIKEILQDKVLTFRLRAGDRGQLFGSVNSRDVVDAIKTEFNIEIERRRVDMEILKTLGDHPVRIRVYPGVTATLNALIERLVIEGEEPQDMSEREPVPAPVGTFVDEDDEI